MDFCLFGRSCAANDLDLRGTELVDPATRAAEGLVERGKVEMEQQLDDALVLGLVDDTVATALRRPVIVCGKGRAVKQAVSEDGLDARLAGLYGTAQLLFFLSPGLILRCTTGLRQWLGLWMNVSGSG